MVVALAVNLDKQAFLQRSIRVVTRVGQADLGYESGARSNAEVGYAFSFKRTSRRWYGAVPWHKEPKSRPQRFVKLPAMSSKS